MDATKSPKIGMFHASRVVLGVGTEPARLSELGEFEAGGFDVGKFIVMADR